MKIETTRSMYTLISMTLTLILAVLFPLTVSASIYGLKSKAQGGGAFSGPPTRLYAFDELVSQFVDRGVVKIDGIAIDADGLALSETHGLLCFELNGSGSRLVSIDPSTAIASPIGSVLPGREIRGATFDLSNSLWVVDEAGDELLRIDPGTGMEIGSAISLFLNGTVFDVRNASDLCIRENGELILATGPFVMLVDSGSGALTELFLDLGPENGREGIRAAFAGAAFSQRANASHLFVYEVNIQDDIYIYDVDGGFSRTLIYGNIISSFNSGGGDLASSIVRQTGLVAGRIIANCPDPETSLLGVTVDAFEVGTGDLVGTDTTDVTGAYEIADLLAGNYTISIVTPLGYSIPSDDLPATVVGEGTTMVDFSLTCLDIEASTRGGGFWKHQVGVGTGGKGKALIDVSTLCGYLDVIEAHFNSNVINQVIIYEPPVSGICADKLSIAKDLLNLKGNVGMTARAKQQLMSVLLNAGAGFLSLTAQASDDGATMSQAITYCDNLIDDPVGDHETAKNIAEAINKGEVVGAGIIPLETPTIAYSRPELMASRGFELTQNRPNPFSSRTAIQLELPSRSEYTLDIYNVAGRLVRRFVGSGGGAVSLTWDGTDSNGRSVAPGIYFYRVEAGRFAKTRRMLLLK